MRPKISIIGAGMVGGQAASLLAQKGIADIVLIDILGDMTKGKALDIAQSLPIVGSSTSIMGGDDYALTKNSDVVVIVAGIARKPGMTREQLLETNTKIVTDVTQKVVKNSPGAILVVVTNPVDAMTWVVHKVSGFPRERVIGMAGALDGSRFRRFIADELKTSPENVDALVIGSHGEEMVPLARTATVDGVLASELSGKARMEQIVQRVKHAGGEIVGLLQQGSAYYAPGTAVAEVVEAIILDKKTTVACSVCLQGEYGVKDYAVGVPVVLGREGIEKVVEIKLLPDEKKLFDMAVKSIQGMIDHARKHIG